MATKQSSLLCELRAAWPERRRQDHDLADDRGPPASRRGRDPHRRHRRPIRSPVLAAVIGAAFIVGLQVGAVLSYGALSRTDVLRSQTLEAPALDLASAFWWPARAALGDIPALAAVLAASAMLFAAAILLLAPRFADVAIMASGEGASPAEPSAARKISASRRRARCSAAGNGSCCAAILGRLANTDTDSLSAPARHPVGAHVRGGRRRGQSAGVGLGGGGGSACRWACVAQHLGRRRAGSRRHRADPQAYVLRAKIEAVIAIIATDLRATRCSPRAGVALARGHHQRRHRHRRHLRQRDPALVPHPGQAQPIPLLPSVRAPPRRFRRSAGPPPPPLLSSVSRSRFRPA